MSEGTAHEYDRAYRWRDPGKVIWATGIRHMENRAQSESVISPLNGGWVRMVEEIKSYGDKGWLNLLVTFISAIAAAGTCVAVLVGWITAGTTNSHDIQALQSTVAQLTAQVSHLADKIDQGPRSDQMKDIDRHLSALDGRMDGMDTRIQSDERSLTRVQTEVETIQSSSDAALRTHVR